MEQLRIGIGLDNCLANTQEHFELWKARVGSDVDSYFHSTFVRDESFWRALKPYPDVKAAARRLTEARCAVYVLTERPVALVPITRAWLRVAGFVEAEVVPLSIKRYDSRLLGLHLLFDSDLEMLKTFVYDDTTPVYIDRKGDGTLAVRCEDYLDEAIDSVLSTYSMPRFRWSTG